MKKLLILLSGLMLCLSLSAFADSDSHSDSDSDSYSDSSTGQSNNVPEFNAASGTLGLGLILAIGAAIRERRRK